MTLIVNITGDLYFSKADRQSKRSEFLSANNQSLMWYLYPCGNQYLVIDNPDAPWLSSETLNNMSRDELTDTVLELYPLVGHSTIQGTPTGDLAAELQTVTNEEYYQTYTLKTKWDDLMYDVELGNGATTVKVRAIKPPSTLKPIHNNTQVDWGYLDGIYNKDPIHAVLSIREVRRDETGLMVLHPQSQVDVSKFLDDPYTYDRDALIYNVNHQYQGPHKNALVKWLRLNLLGKLGYP